MPKALMVSVEGQTLTSGEEFNLVGLLNTTTESAHQYEATEAATLSNLKSKVASGNSGTATFQLRNNAANVNSVFQITGTGTGGDTTHTDAFAAGELMNIAYTDTGSDSVVDYFAGIVEFASGHGCFHGSSGTTASATFSTTGATFYLPLSGLMDANATTTIADVQWRVQAYTEIASWQIAVTANARTTATAVRLNVNGVAVGTTSTYNAAATGRRTITANIALNPGDLICLQVVMGASSENLTVSFVGATMKSTLNRSEIIHLRSNQANARAASATPTFYLPGGSNGLDATEATEQIALGFPATLHLPQILISVNTYAADAQYSLRVNGVDRIVATITAGGVGYFSQPGSLDVSATDLISQQIVGGTSGNLTVQGMGFSVGMPTAIALPGGISDGQVPGIGGLVGTDTFLGITRVR